MPEMGAAVSESLAAPFPYFGGKRRAAATVWRALGDPSGYVARYLGAPLRASREEAAKDMCRWRQK